MAKYSYTVILVNPVEWYRRPCPFPSLRSRTVIDGASPLCGRYLDKRRIRPAIREKGGHKVDVK